MTQEKPGKVEHALDKMMATLFGGVWERAYNVIYEPEHLRRERNIANTRDEYTRILDFCQREYDNGRMTLDEYEETFKRSREFEAYAEDYFRNR